MHRTVLAVAFSLSLFAQSARAADEIAPVNTGLMASVTTANVIKLSGDLPQANFDTTAAPRKMAAPARPAALMGLYTGLAVLQAYDVYSTTTALKMGGTEANP